MLVKFDYSKINKYGMEKNNFDRYKDIESILIYGDKDKIKDPVISIVIPTFRRASTLKAAIDSVLNQVEHNCRYEVIVLDNEPPADEISETEKLIRTYHNDNLLYYKNAQNIGLFGNWNRAFEVSRGRWVAMLHDDDLLAIDYFIMAQKLINKVEHRNKKTAYIQQNAYFINGNLIDDKKASIDREKTGNSTSQRFKRRTMNKVYKYTYMDVLFTGNGCTLGIPSCGTLMNREIFLKEGGYNEDFYPLEDGYYPTKLMAKYNVYQAIYRAGYYRVDINCSIKKENLIRAVESYMDYKKEIVNSGKFVSFFIHFFEKELDAKMIDRLVNLTTSGNCPIDVHEFSDLLKYEPRKVRGKVLWFCERFRHKTKKLYGALFS